MLKVLRLFLFIGLLLAGAGSAAGDVKPAPQGIIVAPSESAFSIQIKADHQIYSPKEPVKLDVELNRDAYVYIYDIDPAGQVTLLFPNGFSRNNLLKAGKHTLPDNSSYSFVVTEPLGLESLQALALLKPIPLLSLSAQGDLDAYPFPQLSGDPKALKPQVEKMIEITVEPGEWAADWTQFLVAPAVAYLKVASQPAGARVFLNGELRGQSPLEIELEPGQVRVALVRDGYQRWTKTITLENHARSELSIRLEPALPPLFPPEPQSPDEGFLPFSSFSLGLNAGLNSEGIFSAGLELGLSSALSVGGSVSFTDDEVPEYFDVGRPQPFPVERIYNYGPETEAYLKLSLPFTEAFFLHGGGGIAAQERVHIAAPGGVIIVSAFGLIPLVEILPNGYSETASYLTVFGGVALRVGEHLLSASYHNRRGWVLGLTLRF
ncbi:MAG: hypothetical protein A2Z21_10735 [Candidatus Fraserbacteria bacterium RBG_16_55_9]|uniref:PEGA domain-containing protein n=1 Tax=Fraserbacteria sp. (strain RBG_16_55_9) TaxID=1817864 RepID=A0A1F5V2Q7_FRAXR|nr:MAG: hypothetical protein A2Z21_10735 [Candidatus Fraserbacteria bacterium RBG_16_55_9]